MIHLIRHAEPTIKGVLLGQTDPPVLVGPASSALPVASVFCSPLLRARETAVALFPDQPAIVISGLAEISLGEWDGLSWHDIEQRDPALAAAKLGDWFGVTPPGGETYGAVIARAREALDTVRQASGPVAIVAHAGINAVLWHVLTGAPITRFHQDYLEVKSYEY
jgi:broad specificity phosphatase PhoE